MTTVKKTVIGVLMLVSLVVILILRILNSENDVALVALDSIDEKHVSKVYVTVDLPAKTDLKIESISENNIDHPAIVQQENKTKLEIINSKNKPSSPQEIATTSNMPVATTTYYNEIIRKLVNFEVTWEELQRQGVNDDEVMKLTDITQENLLSMLNYRKVPYLSTADYKDSGPKISSKADFLIFASMVKDIELYMFDDAGRFCGIIQFGKDGIGIVIEQVQGISFYTQGDRGFMLTGGVGTTTMFFNVSKQTVAQFYTRYGNEENKSYYFPVSTHTKGSASIIRTETKIDILNWNIDVDGDGDTDVSFGHEGPDEPTMKKMIDIIINDSDLPESKRSLYSSGGQIN